MQLQNLKPAAERLTSMQIVKNLGLRYVLSTILSQGQRCVYCLSFQGLVQGSGCDVDAGRPILDHLLPWLRRPE